MRWRTILWCARNEKRRMKEKKKMREKRRMRMEVAQFGGAPVRAMLRCITVVRVRGGSGFIRGRKGNLCCE